MLFEGPINACRCTHDQIKNYYFVYGNFKKTATIAIGLWFSMLMQLLLVTNKLLEPLKLIKVIPNSIYINMLLYHFFFPFLCSQSD